MATKADLQAWVLEALEQLGGKAPLLAVSKQIWLNHGAELVESGDLFYTWQYDVRWAAQRLRDAGRLAPSTGRGPGSEWKLAD